MTWFAIRTRPALQQPRREFHVVETKSGKGYRVEASMDPEISAIERALDEEGFIHYMPVERRLVRSRRKTHHWETRRFAMVPGYVFVADVDDFPRLEAISEVMGVVGSAGTPLPISILDILMLRAMEANAQVEFDQAMELREAQARRVSQRKAKKMFPAGHRVEIMRGLAKGKTAIVVGPERDGRLKAFIEGLDAAGTISVPLDSVKLVA